MRNRCYGGYLTSLWSPLARDRVLDEGGQRDTYTGRDVDTAARDLGVDYRRAADARSKAREPLPPEAASYPVVVGDIPAEPQGFRSRAGSLADLDRLGARVSVIHAVTGRQGLGASQLAAAYARGKLSAGWRLVAWVNGADTDSLLAGLAAVADAAGLIDNDSGRGITDTAAAVRRWLETDGDRCLLVFDDVSDPEVLQAFVPARGTARIVITSTRRSAADLGTAVSIDMFSAAEASAFLAARTGLDDEAGAAVVAAVLGHLPLALALAAPVIKGQRHGYARYLDRLETIPVEQSLTEDDGKPYPHSVARAVLLSLSAIRAADKTGMCSRVMAIIAVLSAAGIRRELLHVAGRAGVLAGGGRRVEAALVDQILEWLSDRSLLTFSLDGQTVMMHRLVARVLRNGLVRAQRLGAVCWIAASVLEAHAIAVAGSQDRPAVRRIPQQVTALLDSTAELTGEADEELAEILLRLRFISLFHLIELGDSASQAVSIGEPLTADLDRLLGPGHPDTLNARNSLAAAYLAAERVADAIPLFEQTLIILQRQLGSGHPDTLTSQNNLASAYQDAGRVAEAIQLYELNLAERERLLGVDHPGTLNSRGNLAAAYLAAGRAAEAIPLFEQTLANREGVLGPDHLDTQASRRSLAKAYQDVGRAAEAIPLLERGLAGRHGKLLPEGRAARAIPPIEQTPAARKSQAPAEDTGPLPSSFRRPPAEAAGPALPSSFRRPPADPAGQLPAERVAGPHAKLPGHSPPVRTYNAPGKTAGDDHEVVATITAGEPAGIAMAYDKYADSLYGYCHWMLRDSADAAESLQDTFVLAATLSELPEPAKLRPWLFALARSQCRRRIRPGSAMRDEAEAANQRADKYPPVGKRQLTDEGRPADEVGRPTDTADWLTDATMQFPAVSETPAAIHELADATAQFRVVSDPSAAIRGPADATTQFWAVGDPPEAIRELADATMQFRVISGLGDATMTFRMVSQLPDETDGLADVNGFLGQAELQALIRSILADMRPREREIVELSFRHDLRDDDLAIVLGMPSSRAHALASRTRIRLEKSFGTLRTALAGRQACPVVGELLADWDGRLSEQTRDLVAWHIEQCQTCINQARGALHPTVLSGLLPLAPLPGELREKVLSRCCSTSDEAVTYRRRVVRRAEATWTIRFSQAARRMSWKNVRANPGAAVAMAAVAVWAAAAVSITLLTFAGSHAARAQVISPTGSPATHAPAARTSAGNASSSAGAVPAAATPSISAAARPSPIFTQSSVPASFQVQPSSSPEASKSPSAKPSKSASPKPSKSPSPSPSKSPSPSPSKSPSPSPSSSASAAA